VPGKAETGFTRNIDSDVIARWKRSRSDVFQLKRVPALLGGEMFPPQRIVCLTGETVETLYLLGEQDRIVGISGYCMRPPEARHDKPRVSAFTAADIPKILGLRPHLVLSFSDLEADIVASLIRQGTAVHAFNQRTVAEIFEMIRMLGAMVGAADRADRLALELEAGIADARWRAKQLGRRPLVYFKMVALSANCGRWKDERRVQANPLGCLRGIGASERTSRFSPVL
jgi:ABC-type Fe3+-hydroxamate transport system substrate-binding protein